jgi:hypothetical protein
MTEKEFAELFIECAEDVIVQLYPKNDTAASGGAPSPGRGSAILEAGVLGCKLSEALRERGFFNEIEIQAQQRLRRAADRSRRFLDL